MKNRVLFVITTLLCIIGMTCSAMPVSAGQEDTSYSLSVIEDEEVPLAPKISEEQLFPYAMVGIALILVFIALALYISECQKYRVRINNLQYEEDSKGSEVKKKSWNLWKLREHKKYLEEKIANKMFEDLKES